MILEEVQILVDLVFHGITNIPELRMVLKLLNSDLLFILHSLIGQFENLLQLLMYQLTGTQSYHDTFAGEKFSKFLKFLKFSKLTNHISANMVSIRNSATMTPAGFPWYDQWGSARYASNNAFLHAVDYSEPFSHVDITCDLFSHSQCLEFTASCL